MKWIKITEKNTPNANTKIAFLTDHILFPDNAYFGIRSDVTGKYYSNGQTFEKDVVTHYFYVERNGALQNDTKPVLCDVFKGKLATLKEDFLPESEHWETGYWHLKKGTQVYIQGNESDGTCYIEYIESVFSIDYRQLNIA